MKAIRNVKLGINPKDMIVNVVADVDMKSKDDADDLYLVMFNIMDSPLRLSLFTIGNLYKLVKRNSNLSEEDILELMKNNPEKYIQFAVGSMDALGDFGIENVKIPLDSAENAKKARLVLSSMISKKKYYQKTTYHIEGEEIKKEQEIDTEPLISQLKMMMEITKRWDNFDPEQFQKDVEKGIIKM